MDLIREKLMRMDKNGLNSLLSLDFKDPITTFMFSIAFGIFGIDRFTIGSIGIGILKLLTFWFWTSIFYRFIFIQNATKEYNYKKLLEITG